MTIDAEFQRHKRTWIGFTRFLRYSSGTVIVILILMALFLL